MEAYPLTVTAVERDGERWIVLPGGNVVRIGEHVAVSKLEAMAVITDRCDLVERQRLAREWAKVCRESRMAITGVAINPSSSEARSAWSRRINSCAVATRQVVRRGSNLKEDGSEPENANGSWERVLRNAAIQCDGTVRGRRITDRWGVYCINLASNVRKRFRRFVPPNIPAFTRRRRTKGKRSACDTQ